MHTVCLPIRLVTVILLLGGCATFHDAPLVPSDVQAAFEARTLDSPELRAFLEANLGQPFPAWPPPSWDLPLLVLAAWYYHPDLDVARAQWGVSQAAVITAGGRLNPGVSLSPQFTADTAAGISPWTLGFNVDLPIETAGKRGYRIAQATHLSEAARLNIATAAWQVRSRLRISLVTLYAADQTAPILTRQQAIQEDVVQLLADRVAVGEASQPDLTQAHIARDQIRLSLLEAKKQAAEARVQLAESLGLPSSSLDGIEVSLDSLNRLPPDLPSQEIRRRALLSRSDLLSGLAEYAAAQAALQSEIAKQYPDIHLGPGYAWDQGDNKWSLGFSIAVPVLNRNEGPIAEAEARRTETAARVIALQTRVIGEMDRALAGYRAARDGLEAAEGLLSDRNDQYETAQAMFEIGEADRLALRSAQLELESTALSRVATLIKAQQSVGLLEDAMQRPLDGVGASPAVPETDPRADKEQKP